MGPAQNLKPLVGEDFDRFFSYLECQLAENGKNGPLFQPISSRENSFPQEKRAAFTGGLARPVGSAGWRRVWIARGEGGDIRAHVDLRSRPEAHTFHRALLGMGVRGDMRRTGLGQAMIHFVCDWAKTTGLIEYVDLSVLSNNVPAIRLYEKMGFIRTGEIEDLFRIDGRSEGDVLMTKRL